MTTKWPVVRKEAAYTIRARHDLSGVTRHPDADDPHDHEWRITVIFEQEFNCQIGFPHDEPDIDDAWGCQLGACGPRLRESPTGPVSDPLGPAFSPQDINWWRGRPARGIGRLWRMQVESNPCHKCSGAPPSGPRCH